VSARDVIAKLLFTTDNRDAPEPDHEWEMTSRHNPAHAEAYYIMADALIQEGYSKDSCCCGTCGL